MEEVVDRIVFSEKPKIISMKKLLLATAIGGLLGFTSCEKCSECSCTRTYTFEADGLDPASQEFIEAQYETQFEEDYPEYSEELCTRRGQHNDSIAAFEGQSDQFEDSSTLLGFDWSIELDYDCVCAE